MKPDFHYRSMPDSYRQTLIRELDWQHAWKQNNYHKDILIVVHNQLDLVRECIESIQTHTQNYNLLIWDNASDKETTEYLNSIQVAYYHRSKNNQGFIEPCNQLFKMGTAPYTILLNSDTRVSPDWDNALLGAIRYGNYGIVGYQGGLLDENGMGSQNGYGEYVDYIAGWCMAFKRGQPLGEIMRDSLFHPQLSFAYGEDAEFCLYARKRGYKIYALHLDYVQHVGGATVKNVLNKEINELIQSNHKFIKTYWRDYLESERILVRKDLHDQKED